MELNQNNSVFDNINTTPEEYIELMFERTDLDGILYLPGWQEYPGWEDNTPGSACEENSLRCRMKWNVCDMDNVLARYRQLRSDIDAISPYHESLYMTLPEIRENLTDSRLLSVWEKYLAPSDTGDLDRQRIADIADRMEILPHVRQMARTLSQGHQLEDYEKHLLMDYIDVTVSPEEKAYYQQFVEAVYKDAEKRVGVGLCAYRLIYSARRLSVLLHLGAPKIIIANEERALAKAMVLHKFCTAVETVSNDLRLQMERLDLMNDEVLDALASPQKTNSRKSLAPVLVYKLLKEQSGADNHLKQQQVLELLQEYPYEVFIERKALSRIIHSLADSQLNIHVDKTGVWYE